MTTEVQNDDTELTEEQLAEQEEADFHAALNGEEVEPEDDGQDEKDETEVEGAEHGEQSQANESAAEDDADKILADLPESVIEKLEQRLTSQIEGKLSGRLRNIEGHIGGLKHNLTQLSTAAKAAESQGADAPSKEQIQEAAQGGEKLAELKEDFPEWAEALEESMKVISDRIPKVDENALDQRFKSTEEMANNLMNKARQMARLDMAHSDWETVIQSDQYRAWLGNQPPEIQQKTYSENASDAIAVLDAFKESLKPPASDPNLTANSRQNSKRLEDAITPTTGGQSTRRQPKTEHEEFLEAFGR